MAGDGEPLLGAVGGSYAVLLGTFLISLFVAGMQIMPASVLTLVMSDLSASPTEAGWLVSLTLLMPAVLALPVGYGLDRFDNRRILVLGVLVVVAANVWGWDAALRGAFLELLLVRLVTGVGIIMTWVSGANLVAAAFASGNTATATGIYTASAPLGYVVGQGLPPFVATHLDWEANFAVFAGLVGASALLFALTGYRTASRAETDRTASLADFRRVIGRRAVWIVALMSFAAYSLNLLFNSWMPTYLNQELGYSLADSGILVALFPLMGFFARTSGGVVSDRLLGEHRRPVPLGSFALTLPIVLVMAVTETPLVIVLLLVLSGYFAQMGVGLFYTHVTELVDEHVAGSAIAVLTMASFTGGFSAPIIAGWLIEQTGSYLALFGYALALTALGIALAWVVPEP